jgi:heme-degrading monooxygenase HmoA
MRHVRIAIYEMKPNTLDAALNKAKKDLVENLQQQPGFVAYQVAKLDGNRTASLTVFETRSAAENGARIIEDWVKKNMAKDVTSSQVHLGELAIDSIGLGAESELHV